MLALEHAWNQAEAFKDLKALDSLFDNSLVYIDYDGSELTKAEFLSRGEIRARAAGHYRIHDRASIRRHGDRFRTLSL